MRRIKLLLQLLDLHYRTSAQLEGKEKANVLRVRVIEFCDK